MPSRPLSFWRTDMELRYFAWVRERIGKQSETYQGSALTIKELLDELETRGDGYQAALADRGILRVALDQNIAGGNQSIKGIREIAIFPPMTGG